MSDIIHLLPDSVANQIAAGEVVQRPASVVKELVENAIDAHATEITISIIDAGRTSIQIIDNGCGMSETDARLSFERHATSKIKEASDIFTIRSMGFRGEALASIAAISQTEVKTRRAEDELGTKICIAGSKVESQEPENCPVGTTFIIKNLFFNTPARRKFLKSNKTEFNYILSEIYQIALAQPTVTFTIYKDNELLAKYPATRPKQRIVQIFGKSMENGLLGIEDESNIVKISGFIGVPEMARKTSVNQYLFVNNRFFRQKSFSSAILRAYGNLIQPKDFPPFFIFLDINPNDIDVNIHPTKTEIKFSDEFNICQLLEATVRYVLGRNNITPSLDFSVTEDYSDMFSSKSTDPIVPPTLHYDANYNPFHETKPSSPNTYSNTRNWEKLFEDYQTKKGQSEPQLDFNFSEQKKSETQQITVEYCKQIQKKYILAIVQEKIYVIDIKRAHYRLLYDSFIQRIHSQQIPTQMSLLPVRIETTTQEFEILQSHLEELRDLGFDIELFGTNCFVVNGIPADIQDIDIQNVIMNYIEQLSTVDSVIENTKERTARSLARSAALFRNPTMTENEMVLFTTKLLTNETFTLTPEGQIITIILEPEDYLKKFN